MTSIKDKYHVQSIKKQLTYDWLLNKHYAHRLPSISYAFGLFNNENVLCGVCTYGMPPLTSVSFICDDIRMNDILELNRLCINDNSEKNVGSYFVSNTIKMLSGNIILLSYADKNQNHHGYIYQATNWLYTGLGSIGTKTYIINNKEIHSRHLNKLEYFIPQNLKYNESITLDQNFKNIGGEVIKNLPKYRYIMIIGDKRFKRTIKNKLKLEILSYPKGDNKRYDASYKPLIQAEQF